MKTPDTAGSRSQNRRAFFRAPRFLRNWNGKLAAAFLLALSLLIAQDPTSFMTPDVVRVGSRLACRCGGCRNTVGDCPMLHCHYADPMRRRIHDMQKAGMTDDEIVRDIVREEGIVALASPPASGWGLFTWLMPFIAIGLGLWLYTLWVRRNQKTPQEVSNVDAALLDRFRDQIEAESDEATSPETGRKPDRGTKARPPH